MNYTYAIYAILGLVTGYVIAALGVFPKVQKNVQKIKPQKISTLLGEREEAEKSKDDTE